PDLEIASPLPRGERGRRGEGQFVPNEKRRREAPFLIETGSLAYARDETSAVIGGVSEIRASGRALHLEERAVLGASVQDVDVSLDRRRFGGVVGPEHVDEQDARGDVRRNVGEGEHVVELKYLARRERMRRREDAADRLTGRRAALGRVVKHDLDLNRIGL